MECISTVTTPLPEPQYTICIRGLPLLMLVSDLARLPADTAVFNNRATTFPADPSSSVPRR